MEDLLRSQIKDNCRLALPNGLKELMSDISREVLREQPKQLFKFITQYLASLLITRENLFLANRICHDLCQNTHLPELRDELGFIGLYEDDIDTAMDIIAKYFEKDQVKEDNLLMKLLTKTKITEEQLEDVQKAIRIAFQRHSLNNRSFYENSSESGDESVATKAARRTINLYKKTNPTHSQYHCLKDKIKDSYEAYFGECEWKNESEEIDSIKEMDLESTSTYTVNEETSNAETIIEEEKKIRADEEDGIEEVDEINELDEINEVDDKSGIEETENFIDILPKDENNDGELGQFSLTKRVKSKRRMSIDKNKFTDVIDDTTTANPMKLEEDFMNDKPVINITPSSSFTNIATSSKNLSIISTSGLNFDENLEKNPVFEGKQQEKLMIHEIDKPKLSKKVKISSELSIVKEHFAFASTDYSSEGSVAD